MKQRCSLGALAALVLAAGCDGASVVGGPSPDRPAVTDLGADVVNDLADAPDAHDAPDGAALDASDAGDAAALDAGDARSGCADNAGCANDPAGPFCDTAAGRCVRCLPSNDTCAAAQHCDPMMFVCVDGCRSDEGCAVPVVDGGSVADAGVPRAVCDTQNNRCVECNTDAQCPSGRLCRGQQCVAGCNTERPCPTGETCCAGACIDTRSNTAACGACGNTCALANAAPVCADGRCAVASCNGTSGDCDNNASNGCETDLSTSLAHCGTCGRACNFPNAQGACAMGSCAITRCNEGFADCDGNPANGCETDLNDSASHCGRCGNACAFGNAAARCAMGVCGLGACNPGFADCDGNAANGCETGLNTTAACGACGRACAPPNADAQCANGQCALGQCAPGFANCDGDADNGCEADLNTGTATCGRCGNTCALANATANCEAGRCAIARCAAGFADCDGNADNGCEVNLQADPLHCGVCGTVCSVPNGGAVCTNGRCMRSTCNQNFADCDGEPSNGCEVNLTNSTANCGRCGNACSVVGGASVCAAGSCVLTTCNAGLGDCDNNRANGCETNLLSAVAHCGACGSQCVAPNGTPGCAAGVCTVASCAAGFANCNARASDGCEVNTQSDVSNCGACARSCVLANATPACRAGACDVAACSNGFGDCDGNAANGCEVDLRASAAHCGACGRGCSFANASAACNSGACQLAACNVGFADCDMSASNGCETNLTNSAASCGRCGAVCSFANASAVCANGACGLGACNPGFGNCDGDPSNGCETNLNTDVNHCGRCSAACATNRCTAGRCDRGADGADGVLTVTGTSPVTATATPLVTDLGAGGQSVRVLSTAGFTVGNEVMIVDTQGGDAGHYEFARVTSVSSTNLGITPGVTAGFVASDRVQVVRVFHYATLTVNAGATLRGAGWNGTTGGVLPIRVSGVATVAGSITQSGLGFRGGAGDSGGRMCGPGSQGESPVAVSSRSTAANGGGGGGGGGGVDCCVACVNQTPGGGGGGYGAGGVDGGGRTFGVGGVVYGNDTLARLFLGSGGGGGGGNCDVASGIGGAGGGALYLAATTLSVASTGALSADGAAGGSGGGYEGGGGGGSGGAVFLAGGTVTLPTGRATAAGATGAVGCSQRGGQGGVGRIRLECGTLNGAPCPGVSGGVSAPAATVGSY
ncbi:MAG: hypothetical protein JNK72_11900 [Myxococcales bacterium]|nr:hypothetical protein [Myxococcales bacterium]